MCVWLGVCVCVWECLLFAQLIVGHMNATRCQFCQCCCCCFVILQPINVDIPPRIAAGGQCGVRWTCPAAQANLADCRVDLTLAAASNCCVNLIATECFHSQTEFCTPRWLTYFSLSLSLLTQRCPSSRRASCWSTPGRFNAGVVDTFVSSAIFCIMPRTPRWVK